MIHSFYSLDQLGTVGAFAAALVIGFLFGLALEQAGFGSSRRLAGIFYFRDMAVLKVMFTAVITAMLGVAYLQTLGVIPADSIYFMPTIWGGQIVGGLLFGVGFVMSGWCPGTGAVGLASGRVDALVFLGGAIGGSILFNELFPVLKPLYTAGDRGVSFMYDVLGLSRNGFALLFTLVAVGCFWGAEWIERRVAGTGRYWRTPFLRGFSLILVLAASGLALLQGPGGAVAVPAAAAGKDALLTQVEAGADHLDPEALADRLMAGEKDLLVVDVRPAAEFSAFHLRGAVNIALPELEQALAPSRNRGTIVLYSNGMTHPAQARDELARKGFQNVYLLTDGLQGFRDRCLKPASLRREPLSAEAAQQIGAWRNFFLAANDRGMAVAAAVAEPIATPAAMPGLVDTAWLAGKLGQAGLVMLDLRPQPEYNSGHIPGTLSVNPENLRGMVNGLPSMLLPAEALADHFSRLGLAPADLVVLVYGDKPHDATLVGMALARVGHRAFAVLDGGYLKWQAEKRPVDLVLPPVRVSVYRPTSGADRFTLDAARVLQMSRTGVPVIDVRPADYYSGKKSDEARAGHIPGARNRPFSEDVTKSAAGVFEFKPVADLATAYNALAPDRKAPVIVHCRTGHQASQTYFVLRYLLGYQHVLWYDAGWTEWAAKPEYPVETTPAAPNANQNKSEK